MEAPKVGDRIEVIREYYAGIKSETGTIKLIENGLFGIEFDNSNPHRHSCNSRVKKDCGWWLSADNFVVIKSKNSFMKNLKEIVSGIFATEPQKSRQTAGIVDKEGKLTAEGKDVYLDFLLSKENPADEKGFDQTIVSKVVAEIEKNNKK